MKFCIVGTGGVGGFFGAKLAADGNEVIFVARGAHREAMEKHGLRVRTEEGDLHIAAPRFLDDPREAGLCDVILICVKLWDTETAADLVAPLVGRDTAAISLQNGVTAADRLAAKLGPGNVLGGVGGISAHIVEPGVIQQTGTFARLIFGERDGSKTWRQEALHAACVSAGFGAIVSDNIERDLWHKFGLLAPVAGACALHRATIGALRDDPAKRAQLETLVDETLAVGRAKGVDLGREQESELMARFDAFPAEMKPSMLIDLEAGRRLELDWLNGEVLRLGRELAIATPENAALVEALAPYRKGSAG